MIEYWFDSMFFIAAKEANKLNVLRELFSLLNKKYKFKITNFIFDEILFFKDTIKLYFEIENVDSTPEFQQFCFNVRYCLHNSKAKDEPADKSLAFAAVKTANQAYIVTNDEGFSDAKKIESKLMLNVEIIEPTDFFSVVIKNIEDEAFKKELEKLVIKYADKFIRHRLKNPDNPRPIERILKSLILFSYQSILSYTAYELPENIKGLIKRFISNEILNSTEKETIKSIIPSLTLIANVKKAKTIQEHENLIKVLYLKMPELIATLKKEAEKEKAGLLTYFEGLQEIIEKEIIRIRIEETIYYFKDCLFDEAYYHFSPLLETNWNLNLNAKWVCNLKFLYGIFQLHFQDFDFLSYLMENNFWEEYSEVKEILKILLDIKNGKLTDKVNSFSYSDLLLLYNLGLYFANAGNSFGLKIFDTLFQLTIENIKGLKWCKDFFKRYLLELRINQKNITESMEKKFLSILDQIDLEDNTRTPFDRSCEFDEFTPLEKCTDFYKQSFYFMRIYNTNEQCEIYCWNAKIKSIVILSFPIKLCSNLKNIKTIKILNGNIKTSNIPTKIKKNARKKIELDINCQLNIERFHLEIMEDFKQKP